MVKQKTSTAHKILTIAGTVLCIILIPILLINITLPIFLFLCRHKDLGMPARRAAQPQSEPEVVPMAEAPAEPWENPEE